MSELCERFAYQSQIITSSGDNESEVEEAFSSEIQRRFPFVPVAQLRSSLKVQLKEAVQATAASSYGNENQEDDEEQVPPGDHSTDVREIVPYHRRRRRVACPGQTIIRTPLKEIRCSTPNFRSFAPCTQKLTV
jgi:hypothetical protein